MSFKKRMKNKFAENIIWGKYQPGRGVFFHNLESHRVTTFERCHFSAIQLSQITAKWHKSPSNAHQLIFTKRIF